MDAKTYLKISLINLAFLMAGILIGMAIMGGLVFLKVVHAQNPPNVTTKVDSAASPSENPNIEYITPAIGLGGPVVTNTLLANRIACDRLQVGDFDILKTEDAVLALLQKKGLASQSDIQTVVANSKVERPLRIKPNPPSPSTPAK